MSPCRVTEWTCVGYHAKPTPINITPSALSEVAEPVVFAGDRSSPPLAFFPLSLTRHPSSYCHWAGTCFGAGMCVKIQCYIVRTSCALSQGTYAARTADQHDFLVSVPSPARNTWYLGMLSVHSDKAQSF